MLLLQEPRSVKLILKLQVLIVVIQIAGHTLERALIIVQQIIVAVGTMIVAELKTKVIAISGQTNIVIPLALISLAVTMVVCITSISLNCGGTGTDTYCYSYQYDYWVKPSTTCIYQDKIACFYIGGRIADCVCK